MERTTNFAIVKFLILFFLLFVTNSYSRYVFNTSELSDKISLHKYTTIADVGQRDLDIQFVIKNYQSLNPKKLKTESDYLGFSENHFWSKTEIKNSTDSELYYYLETARPTTDLVELFIIDEKSGKIIKKISGDAMTYSERDYDTHNTVFSLKMAPKANLKLFMHLKSDGAVVKFPVVLYSPDFFIKKTSKEQLLYGFFYGALGIVAVIYFFFFLALKEKTFLYYVLYVVSVGLFQFASDGFFYHLVTPGGGWFSNHAVLFFAIIGSFLSGKYSEVFLRIKKHSKKIYNLYRISYGLLFALLVSTALIPASLPYCYKLANIFALIFLVIVIYTIGYLYYNKKPVDSLFTIGIFFFLLGFGVFILNNLGLIANTFIAQISSKLGTGLEVVFLSLSMSNLIRILKNEKNDMTYLALVRSEEMNDLKSFFLSNISHELRTPLNAIMNLTDSVSSAVADEKIKRNCQLIKYSSHSLLSSVNDILDFSKIEKKEIRLERVKFNPLKALEKVKNSAEIRAEGKGLQFVFSKPDNLPDFFIGDETRLIQIVNNVLNNAIKFTGNGFVLFKIEGTVHVNNRVSLMLTVSDSGVGIPKEKMHSIFDSFSQNNINNKRKFGGLGLGLFIVKTLVDMQGGTVEMKSEVNKGTTCKITIDYDVVEEKIIPVADPDDEVCDLGGKTILVVEDNAMNQMVIKMITKKWLNTSVIYTNNGQEGVDAFADNKIDLVLMDLQMPVMDGYEATIAIRNGEAGLENKNVPIIAVTADIMETTKDSVFEIGMNDYLSKPVKKEALYEVVQKCFNSVLV